MSTAAAITDPTNPANAQTVLAALQRLSTAGTPCLHVPSDRGDDQQIPLPAEAVAHLTDILGHLAEGRSVMVVPLHEELTTQQAADLLGVSRPFVVKLLDTGVIPHRKAGSHRRVRAADVLAYKQRDDAERRTVADALTAEAEALGLGY